jgi:hypothetical protein
MLYDMIFFSHDGHSNDLKPKDYLRKRMENNVCLFYIIYCFTNSMSFQPMTLTSQEKLDLQRLLANAQDWEDNTETIRTLQHSERIAQDVLSWLTITSQTSDIETCQHLARNQCTFLATTYPDIFQKMITNVLDMTIFSQFVHYLQMIEQGKVNQAECSAMIGKLLQQLYLDSAIRHGEKLDEQYPPREPKRHGHQMTWSEYKQHKTYE